MYHIGQTKLEIITCYFILTADKYRERIRKKLEAIGQIAKSIGKNKRHTVKRIYF